MAHNIRNRLLDQRPQPIDMSASGTRTVDHSHWQQDIVRCAGETRTEVFGSADGAQGPSSVRLSSHDFEKMKKLGEGAAGTVWKVRYKPNGRIMAKKMITAAVDHKERIQIARELSVLNDCQYKHIITYYGTYLAKTDASVNICMELCEGGSLEDIYKQAKAMNALIGETVLARIAQAVCKGLNYLRSKNIIHRDIKPSNILMTRKGEIKLCDFGVSGKLIQSQVETFTGTQYYMAPERIRGRPYSVRSDIWSLGLTIIEVARNEPALPPPGHPPMAFFELLHHIVHEPLPTVGEDRSSLCQEFVAKCLVKDPSERPGPKEMLEHAFIKRKADQSQDLGKWLQQVWGWDK